MCVVVGGALHPLQVGDDGGADDGEVLALVPVVVVVGADIGQRVRRNDQRELVVPVAGGRHVAEGLHIGARTGDGEDMHTDGIAGGVGCLVGVIDAVMDESHRGVAHLHHAAGALSDPPSGSHFAQNHVVGHQGAAAVEAGGAGDVKDGAGGGGVIHQAHVHNVTIYAVGGGLAQRKAE